MSAYFNGSGNSQIRASSSSSADGLQTLIFMNPNNNTNLNNPNNHNKTDFVFINSSMSPATTHQLVGIPLHHENVSPSHGLIPRPQYNLWTPIESSTVARETPRAQQGLSLSLSNSQVGFNGSLQQLQAHSTAILSPSENTKDEGMETPSPASVISNGPVTGMRSVLMSSKYLKATQQLLEEIVNVGSSTPTNTASSKKKDTDITNNAADTSPDTTAAKAADGQNTGRGSAELSTTEKQEIHLKKGKLICILNEVEQRYRQYHQQMQIVIASFEQAAGQGSAKTYTALALKTISKQFRCLKDAILTQISAVNKSLGEEEDVGEKELGGSVRLKFVDHHLRQQLALQQLGMIQHHNNAWRPQRGLPERSVSVLRAWLFEHFLHPYPKDSDKQMLARQTGLTRSQVSNWFINARVRLWKPMVEEMYNEELKEHENQVQGSADKTGSASTSKVPTEEKQNLSFKNASQETTGFSLIGTSSSELEGIGQMSPKRQRINDQMVHHHHHHHLQHQNNPSSRFQSAAMEMNSNDHVQVKFGIERQPRDHDYSLIAVGPANFIGGFGSYPMEEIGRFDVNQFDQSRFSGNGVSLTLGRTDTPQSFIPTQSSGEWTLQARQLNSVP